MDAIVKSPPPPDASDPREWIPFRTLGAAFILLVIIIAGSLYLFARTQVYANEAIRTQTTISQLLGIRAYTREAESGQRGYLLTNSPRYLTAYNAAAAAMGPNFDALHNTIPTTSPLRGDIDKLQDLVNQKMAELKSTVELMSAGRQAEALAVVNTDRGLNLMKSIQALSKLLVAEQQQVLEDTFAKGKLAGRSAVIVSIVAALLIVGLAVSSMKSFSVLIGVLTKFQRDLEAANEGLEVAVQERTAELRDANEELQRYAYIVSHDLRSPLVNVMGFTSEIEALTPELIALLDASRKHQTPVLDEEVQMIADDFKEAIGFIKVSTEKMDRLIAAILKLAREGRRTFNQDRVDLNEILATIAGAEAHRCQEIGAEIKINNLPSLVADRLALEQIFSNLVDNALKYLKPDRPGLIEITGSASPTMQIYTVQDNGRGIDPRDHQRVFELFRRSGDQNVPGEGIGLAHVRTLVRASGGSISCESVLNQGTRFILRFPILKSRKVATI